MTATVWTHLRSVPGAGAWIAAPAEPLEGPDPAEAERLLNEGLLPPRFVVRARLGAGGDGAVYQVFDAVLERQVAIKLVRGDHAAAGREVRLAARLDHPHLVPVHDGGRCGGGWHWFAMRLAGGRPLDGLLDDPQLGLAARVRMLVQVCEALAHAHQHGICHHDLKPGNILVDAQGVVLLTDWGSATTADERAAGARPLSGTPAYMSPEQSRQEVCDERSDVWGVGSTLFHLLFGRPPLVAGRDTTAFWEAKRIGRIDPPDAGERRRVPRALVAIALHALEPEPTRRYPSVLALRDDLVRWLDGQAVSVLREGPGARLCRWVGRNPRAAQGYAIAGVLLVLAGIGVARFATLRARSWQPVLDGIPARLDREAWSQVWFPRWRRGSAAVVPADDPAGPWRAQDGALVGTLLGTGNGCANLTWRLPPGRDLRLDAQVVPEVCGANVNLVLGRTRYDGLVLHLGGWGDPTSAILTAGPLLTPLAAVTLPSPVPAGVPVRLRAQLTGDRLGIRLDERVLFDQVQVDRRLLRRMQWAGFEVAGNRLRITALRIERLGQPGLVDAVGLGDILAEQDNHRAAIAHWRVLLAQDGQDPAELWMRIAASQEAMSRTREADAAWREAIACGDAGQRMAAALARLELAIERGELDTEVPHDLRQQAVGLRQGLLWAVDRAAWRRCDLATAARMAPMDLDQALERHLAILTSWSDRLGIVLGQQAWLQLPPGLRDGAQHAFDGLRWRLLDERYGAVQRGLVTDLLRWRGRPGEAAPHPISGMHSWLRALVDAGRMGPAVDLMLSGAWSDSLRRDPRVVAAFAASGRQMPADQPLLPPTPPPSATAAVAQDEPPADRWTERVRAMHLIVDALEAGHGLGALVRVAEMRAGAPSLAGGLEMDPCFPAIVHAALGDAAGARALLAPDPSRQPADYRPADQRRLADLAAWVDVDAVLAGLPGDPQGYDHRLEPALVRGLAASLAGDQRAAVRHYRTITDARLRGLAAWGRFLTWMERTVQAAP